MCVGERTLLGDGEHLFSEESALSNAEKVCIRKRVCVGERTLLGDGEHLFSEESALSSARKDVLMPTNVR